MLWDEFNTLRTKDKLRLWNFCYPHIPFDIDDPDEIEGFDNITDQYYTDFVGTVKYVLWKLFEEDGDQATKQDCRREAITQAFKEPEQQAEFEL